MQKKQNPLKLGLIYLFLTGFTLATIYPILRVITISLRPGDRLLSTSLALIPPDWTLNSYRQLLFDSPFLRWLLNSSLIALVVTITGVALASTAGYSFSRFRFPGRSFWLGTVLTTQMFPATMLLLPLYVMLAKLRLINTYLGLIVAYSATALPFCIWQMKGYYDTIPPSLEEAARIDGCSRFRSFYRIVLPLASPALVITALFSFMSAWAEYMVAAQILQSPNLFTLPLGLKQFQSNMTTQWGLYAAGSVVVGIPIIILFLILSRWLISGLTLGGVKG